MEPRRKAIGGYGDRYEVTSDGRVLGNGCELSPIRGHYVNLSWKGDCQRVDVAYLVARAFLPNPEGRPYVKRLNGDVNDCRAANLMWVEQKPVGRGRAGVPSPRVVQYALDGGLVKVHENLTQAAKESGVARSLIKKCCDGYGRKSGGFMWRYE